MLTPKKVKFRKVQKGRINGVSQNASTLAFGNFGLKILEPKYLTSRQIEAARIAITRYMKREGQLWIRVFPDKPMTKKPAEVRMGKGKGNPEFWVAVAKPGRIVFEIDGVDEATAREAFRLGAQKMPGLMRVVVRPDYTAD